MSQPLQGSSTIQTPEALVNSTAMEYFTTHQVVLVLVGLIGSGKVPLSTRHAYISYILLQSTLADALNPTFVRCNQDDLGDRRAVERAVRESLRLGRSVCIDRANFDQRHVLLFS